MLGAANTLVKTLLKSARERARTEGVTFDLSLSDILIPDSCPALGTPLVKKHGKGGGADSPSLDRLKPELGYVPGNVAVISNRANSIKNNATSDEILKVCSWLEAIEHEGLPLTENQYAENPSQRPPRVVGVREPRSITKQRYYAKNLPKVMWGSAKNRAERQGVPFKIAPQDIFIPCVCPALGLALHRMTGRGGGDCSPSLDRVVPSLGYAPGNVVVISSKANRIKHDASSLELRKVGNWLQGIEYGV